jgi:hypothetical protein
MNIDATHLMQHVFPSELAWLQREKKKTSPLLMTFGRLF